LVLLLVAGGVLWVRRFHRYTPAEAVQDLRAAALARYSPRPVERFLEVRYGPLTEPANRQKAFLDFFNVGHIEGLYIIVGRMGGAYREARIASMAEWIAEYRSTMSPEEMESLRASISSEAGRATLQQATAAYLQKDVRFRAATASVIAELMATLAAVQSSPPPNPGGPR
jgi:hypothetical protein